MYKASYLRYYAYMTLESRSGIRGLIGNIIRITSEPYEPALERTQRVYNTELAGQAAYQFKPHLPTHVIQSRHIDLLGGVLKLPFPPKKTLFSRT